MSICVLQVRSLHLPGIENERKKNKNGFRNRRSQSIAKQVNENLPFIFSMITDNKSKHKNEQI